MRTTYDFIAQNKRRTWLLVLLFPLLFCALSYVFIFGISYATNESNYLTEEEAIYYEMQAEVPTSFKLALSRANDLAMVFVPLVGGLAVLWIVCSWCLGGQILLKSAGAVEITHQDQPDICNLVENLCIASGLPMPKVYIINDDSLNAFATGRDPQHASIALTKGIVSRLEREELNGVIAHELSHIKHRDIRLMLITVVGVSFFTLLSEICFRMSVRTRHYDNKSGAQVQILFFILGALFAFYGYFIAPLIRLAISRTREYYADAGAAYMTRNPRALASALAKISQDARVEILEQKPSMAAICIANPLGKMGLFSVLTGLLSTHPPIEKRIEALLTMDRGGMPATDF